MATSTLDLPAIRTALAEVITNGVDSTVNVYAFLPQDPRFPCVAITAADDFISPNESMQGTVGQLVEIHYDLLIGGRARPQDALTTIETLIPWVIVAIRDESANPGSGGILDGLTEGLACTSVSMLTPDDVNSEVFAAVVRVAVLARL